MWAWGTATTLQSHEHQPREPHTRHSEVLRREGEIHPQTIATHLLTRLFYNLGKASSPGLEGRGTGCFRREEKHSWVRFPLRRECGWGWPSGVQRCIFHRILETQFGPEGKQLQIMHLHGTKTIGPIHVIIPYKYRRCRQSKADTLSSQLIL